MFLILFKSFLGKTSLKVCKLYGLIDLFPKCFTSVEFLWIAIPVIPILLPVSCGHFKFTLTNPKRIHFFNSIFCTTLGKIHGDFWMAVSRERLIRGSCPAVRNWPPFLNCKTQNQINNHSAVLVQRIHIAQVCWKEHLFDNRADADVRVSTAYCRPKVTCWFLLHEPAWVSLWCQSVWLAICQ